MTKHLLKSLAAGAITALCFVAGVQAQVNIKDVGNGRYDVEINGKPFGDFYTSKDAPKPYFSPLRTADGKVVTREWPMLPNSGTTRDHQHHRGLWVGYIDVNGTNFWENEYSYHRPNAGTIVSQSVEVVNTGGTTGTIHGIFAWLDQTGNKVLTEDRTMTFRGTQNLRMVDMDVTLTAAVKAVFADDKDGAVAVRMADSLTEKAGGLMTDSTGGHGMKEIWGKRADWCDYTGTMEGGKAGLVILEHPTSFHHPTRWHARDYGLLAANPFADHAYDPSARVRNVTLEPGESVHLRFRIIVHGEIDTAEIDKLYKEYARSNPAE
ncbi:MAG: PmoA family protein [Acidobacteriaceae bacterium]|nr:PmoA family protein [Acidobacteriaceae bacterium]